MVTCKVSQRESLYERPSDIAIAMGNATPFLVEAIGSFEDCQLTACGCQMREAIKRYIRVLVDSAGISHPTKTICGGEVTVKTRHWSTTQQIRSLVEIHHFCPMEAKNLLSILTYCHRLAHCEPVPSKRVAWCLEKACRAMCMGYLYRMDEEDRDELELEAEGEVEAVEAEGGAV